MATVYFLGIADAVAQVHTGSIDSVDGTPANNTFTVTIGGVAIDAVGDTDVATTATNLRASLNASAHPYFAAITWSGSAGDIIGTADTAGCPFVAALTETGAGTGAVTDFAETTASAGPNHFGTATNWSGGAVPVATDDVVIDNSSVNICWDLNQSVDYDSLVIKGNYTGKLGLDRTQFATSADGATYSATAKEEYREDYLIFGADTIDIGEYNGAGTVAGSGRIKLDNDQASASTLTVHDTVDSNGSADSGLPAVRYKVAHASSAAYIRKAPGGVGFAADEPGETSTIGTISVSDTTSAARVEIGFGVTVTTVAQKGGRNVLDAAATVTTVTVDGGLLRTEGDYTVTTLNANKGTVVLNHIKTAGSAVTTTNIDGGTVDLQQSTEARTLATVNLTTGTLKGNDSVTITTLNEQSGDYSITAA